MVQLLIFCLEEAIATGGIGIETSFKYLPESYLSLVLLLKWHFHNTNILTLVCYTDV